MRFTSPSHTFQLGRRSVRFQTLLYAGLLLACIALMLPWPTMSMGLIAVAVISIACATAIVWLVIRHHHLQARVRHLESQLRQLHHQRTHQPLEAQTLLHVEPEHFFNKEQTRH